MYLATMGNLPYDGDTLRAQLFTVLIVSVEVLYLIWLLEIVYFNDHRLLFIKRK